MRSHYRITFPTGNLALNWHDSAITIPLGVQTELQLTAESVICPDGPFVYAIFDSEYIPSAC